MALLLFAVCAPLAGATFTFGTAASQDPLPPCSPLVACNGGLCADVCEDGSLQLPPWLSSALRFQHNLTRARSWKLGPHLGTHNAMISRANGMGLSEDFASAVFARSLADPAASHVRIPNQRFGLWDLLNMGVRHVEYDIWDVDWGAGGGFEVYICHNPASDPLFDVALQQGATALGLGPVDYHPLRELCSNHTLGWAMAHTTAWLAQPGNGEEVLGLFLDNRVATWNAGLVADALTAAWGASLLTPGDLAALFNGSFPSRDAMLAKGKRAYCESNAYAGNDYANTTLAKVCFYPTTWDAAQFGGGQPGPGDVRPFPNCTVAGAPPGWYGGGAWPRLLDSGDLQQSPSESSEKGVVLKPTGVADLAACAIPTVGLADITPAAVEGWVWSWAPGEPAPGGGRCAAMAQVRGRWAALPCAAPLRALCRRGSDAAPAGAAPDLWALSPSAVAWAAGAAACEALGAGWRFSLPREGRENALVAQRALLEGLWARGEGGIWLNYAL
jgi:hypothetical protein